MNRFYRTFLWFLLVPYFAVASLNVAPWIGETRQDANRTNAQCILGLIFVSPIFFALSATGYVQHGLIRDHPIIFAIILYVPAVLLIGAWLKGDREREYRRKYTELPLVVRVAFGLATGALIVAGTIAFVVPA